MLAPGIKVLWLVLFFGVDFLNCFFILFINISSESSTGLLNDSTFPMSCISSNGIILVTITFSQTILVTITAIKLLGSSFFLQKNIFDRQRGMFLFLGKT
jgi:hypothetical protein